MGTFGGLPIGTRFVFCYGWPSRIGDHAPCTKTSRDWYKDDKGKSWRTSQGVAVAVA